MMKPIVLLLFLSLTACAGSQQFDCPYKEGARCLSVGEIDQKMVFIMKDIGSIL